MDSLPVCEICRQQFTLKGPSPFLLSCLHPVCETCVASHEIITCSSCQSNVRHRTRHRDLVRQLQIIKVTAKHLPSELVCTLEKDGNQAVCWCQHCQKLFCDKCCKGHDENKATQNHDVQMVGGKEPADLETVRYCKIHRSHPLDAWNVILNVLSCAMCKEQKYGKHTVSTNFATVRSELKSQAKDVICALQNHKSVTETRCKDIKKASDYAKMKIRETFASLKKVLIQRESELLDALDEKTDELETVLKKKRTSSEARCKITADYIQSALSLCNYDLLKVKSFVDEPVQICLNSGSEEIDDFFVPAFNSEGVGILQSVIPSFGYISARKQDMPDMSSTQKSKSIIQYDRDILMRLRYTKESTKRHDSLKMFPEITLGEKSTEQKKTQAQFGRPDGESGQKIDHHKVSAQTSPLLVTAALHKSDNPWKPQHKLERKEGAERQNDELFRKIRSILNKLTPQKFQILIKQTQRLVIDTETKLEGIAGMIFEKAIMEPQFSVTYANMCRYLLTLKVPSDVKPGETIHFRVVLLTKCQRFFELEEVMTDKKETEKDHDKLADELQEESVPCADVKKKRYLGNIRFMGELFKLKILTQNIMHDCLFKLLRSQVELHLFSSCVLLTTIGKDLDSEKAKKRMDQYFQHINKIISQRKISNRCRFKLQDVVELRDNNWIPRRKALEPKTIYQIHKDAEREMLEEKTLTALKQQQHHHLKQSTSLRRAQQHQLQHEEQKCALHCLAQQPLCSHQKQSINTKQVIRCPEDKLDGHTTIHAIRERTDGFSSASSPAPRTASMDWIEEAISEMMINPKSDSQEIIEWIMTHVLDDVMKTPLFIRTLSAMVYSRALVAACNMTKVDAKVIRKWRTLLMHFLDQQPEQELQALYALQSLVHSLGHPAGVLRTFFDTLYDEEIICEHAFKQWETSTDESEGKEVALRQVVQFFAWLSE